LDSHKGSRWELGLYNGAFCGGKLPQVQNATTGAEAGANLEASRGAEAPFFHGITRIRDFFREPPEAVPFLKSSYAATFSRNT
jgi:hypothetical protein